MSTPLTPRQKSILDALRRYFRQRGYMPTVRDLAKMVKSAASTVQQHLERLQTKGWITHDGSPRGIALLSQKKAEAKLWPLVVTHHVSRGITKPIPPGQRRFISLPLVAIRPNLMVAEVVDTSLHGKGVHQGDLLLIDVRAHSGKSKSGGHSMNSSQGRIIALIRLL